MSTKTADPFEAMRLYTIHEVGEILRRSDRTVRRLIDAGGLPWVELSDSDNPLRGAKRVRADDLQAYIDSRTYGRKPVRS